MTGSGLEGWHVTLFVTALIALIATTEWLINDPPWKSRTPPPKQVSEAQVRGKRIRAYLLAALSLVAVVIMMVGMFGPTLADQLAGVTTVPLGVLTLYLTYLTYRESRILSALAKSGANPVTPEQPVDQ